MSFAMPSGKGQPAPQMNVTPLVDVVLVLLIIFMVVTPLLTKQFWLHLPPDQKAETPPPPGLDGSVRAITQTLSSRSRPMGAWS